MLQKVIKQLLNVWSQSCWYYSFRWCSKVSFKDGTLFTENGNFKVGSIDLICGGNYTNPLKAPLAGFMM